MNPPLKQSASNRSASTGKRCVECYTKRIGVWT
jgi:hypothetical protein